MEFRQHALGVICKVLGRELRTPVKNERVVEAGEQSGLVLELAQEVVTFSQCFFQSDIDGEALIVYQIHGTIATACDGILKNIAVLQCSFRKKHNNLIVCQDIGIKQ
jgi:hypothetical protein